MRVDDIQVFVETADAGSFSAAAKRLDMTPALASSSVQRLEDALGVRLFVRSTRSLRLSEDGERYLPHARAALEAITDGEQALALARQEIRGVLRLSAPSDLGRNILLPWLEGFQDQHPRLHLQLHISDRVADLYRLPLDAAIRYGPLVESGLVAQPLSNDNRRALCASPAYVSANGRPNTPEDLQDHNCLRFVWGDQVYDRWRFNLPNGVRTVAVTGDLVSDDADVVRRLAVSGRGVVYKSRIDLLPDIRAGRLLELFPAVYGEAVPLNLVCAHRSLLTPAIQLLRDYLRSRCSEIVEERR
ncbi:LysR family transcriptional regulator [Dyella sp. C9]|uniref:LysR family transcriptional regulator n=1 Tax=Dyella sp. C9 TaxID=2202154 RepID=UPI001E554513|nr:LysR family transcriptional regulator [Dyella sp. C9]